MAISYWPRLDRKAAIEKKIEKEEKKRQTTTIIVELGEAKIQFNLIDSN